MYKKKYSNMQNTITNWLMYTKNCNYLYTHKKQTVMIKYVSELDKWGRKSNNTEITSMLNQIRIEIIARI